MDAPLFYVPPDKVTDTLIALPTPEARHAQKVLRMKKGDAVIVVDGCGRAYRGFLDKVGSSGVTVTVHQTLRNMGEPLVKLTLGAGLSTAGKFDTVVQKATELGASRIIPLACARSKVRLDDPKRATAKRKRLEKVAIAAMKQCRRSVCPAVSEPMSVAEFIDRFGGAHDRAIIFDPGSPTRPLGDVIGHERSPSGITVLVGPESGFAREEVEAARSAGFAAVTMGTRILRTETAAPVACALVMGALGELD